MYKILKEIIKKIIVPIVTLILGVYLVNLFLSIILPMILKLIITVVFNPFDSFDTFLVLLEYAVIGFVILSCLAIIVNQGGMIYNANIRKK